jgi:hypothetical protein
VKEKLASQKCPWVQSAWTPKKVAFTSPLDLKREIESYKNLLVNTPQIPSHTTNKVSGHTNIHLTPGYT